MYIQSMIPWPDFDRTGSEREILLGVLNQQRAILLWKLEGLSLEQASRPLVDSGTSLLGIVKHMAWVEKGWFCRFIDNQEFQSPWTEQDPDADFRIEPGETIQSISEFYVASIAEADAVTHAAESLDIFGERDRGPRSLRWVLVHMIEETARHAGQADILREQIDNATGYYPTD